MGDMDKKTPKEHSLENYLPDNPERQLGDRWVAMKNALTRAGHGLSLSEKRLVMLALSALDSKATYIIGQVPMSRVTAKDYAELYEVDPNTAYDQLQAAAKSLYNRSITIFEHAAQRKGRSLRSTIRTDMRWVGRCKYHEGEGWVEIAWWPELIPYISKVVRGNFTSYQLKQASALRSVHSWRLLELLLRFESTGWAEYTIEDFSTSMDATEKQRADFGKIRTKIIEPAVKELTEKDDWIINWKPIKAGRRVAKIRFEFKREVKAH